MHLNSGTMFAPPPTKQGGEEGMSNCQAVVGVGDSTASCELAAPHPGTAHHAVVRHTTVDWVSDGEARATQRKAKVDQARHDRQHQIRGAHPNCPLCNQEHE